MLNKLRIPTKIAIPIFIILIVSSIVTNYITSSQMNTLVKNSSKDSLSMLTDSIFITLRNDMNTGDSSVIKQAEDDSRKNIKGLSKLAVAKSKGTLELYSPDVKYTTDKDILKTFSTKKEQVIEFYKDDSHYFRVLRPMIATNDCMMCHANEKIGDVIGVIDLSFSLDKSDDTIYDTLLFILTISILFIILTLATVWFISKKATAPLENLKNEMLEFFSFLSHEKDTIEPFKITYMDEIGEIVETLNQNIIKVLDDINKDKKAIEQSSYICSQVSLGHLDVKIDTTSSNPDINNLIGIVNKLIVSLDYNINRTLEVLDLYDNDEYGKKINSQGKTTGSIKKLFDQVDKLGETLTQLSTQNLKNGKALQQTADIVTKNVSQLKSSSYEQSQLLDDAKVSVEDIMDNIKNTSKNSKEMSNISKNVEHYSKDGQELANQTTVAMGNINEKINAIMDALELIKNIAFQTNILSLNAAVEAATAGEAGKGFAVVAQEVRNLASRSSDASQTIEDLITLASNESKKGDQIANNMIDGYNKLNERIKNTINIIDIVAKDNDAQMVKIEEINDVIKKVDDNSLLTIKIVDETNIVAQQSSRIASNIVADASGKEFTGKEKIKVRGKIEDHNYAGENKRIDYT